MNTSISHTQTYPRANSRRPGPPGARDGQEEPIVPFACDVVTELQGIARELSKEPGIKGFCSSLAATLSNVLEYLDGVQDGLGSISKVSKLVDNLERLCQWPTPSTAKSGAPQTYTVDRRRYPALKRLLEKKHTVVKKSMKEFASDSKAIRSRQALIKLLAGFEINRRDAPGPDISEIDPTEAVQERQDYQAYIQKLYTSLASHCLCHENNGNAITANLRLNGCCVPGEVANSVDFRLFFLDHPHRHGLHDICQWQDTRIRVSRKSRFRMNDEHKSDNGAHAGTKISMQTFCKTITNRNRSQLSLMVSDVGFVLEGPGSLSQGFLLGASSMSLADLISTAELPKRMKLLLSYFLARSVWQFYNSEWMQREWTKDTVHFMFQRIPDRPSGGIFVNEPFLSACFDGARQVQAGNEYRSHMFPKILALGIMLLEIELRINIEDYRMPENVGPNGEPNVNADHIAATEVFNNKALWASKTKDTFKAVKDVIGACLTADKFKPFKDDVEGLRDTFEKCIVNPLHILYKTAWEDPDLSEIDEVDLDSLRPSLPEIDHANTPPISPSPIHSQLHAPVASPEYQHIHYQYAMHADPRLYSLSPHHSLQYPASPSLTPLSDGTMSASTSNLSSDDWFGKFDRLKSVLRLKPNERDDTYQAVKVAILDTGLSGKYAEEVYEYKDFVDKDREDCDDSTSHGTSAFLLVQQIYPTAKICVGKVFAGAKATDNTVTLMTEAIRHAQSTWKVSIIIMPSGFQSEDSELEKAIDEARHAGILIFAAASNYGNVLDIAFPARLYIDLKLFCMFSTNASVRAQPTFNPSALENARYSFAILGEDVKIPMQEQLVSGTSYAAMIGGAVAARILDFARQKENRARIRKVERLSTVEGMSAVFEPMVALDNKYHCLAPWKILPSEIRGEALGAKRQRERAHVCETISRALEGMHRK